MHQMQAALRATDPQPVHRIAVPSSPPDSRSNHTESLSETRAAYAAAQGETSQDELSALGACHRRPPTPEMKSALSSLKKKHSSSRRPSPPPARDGWNNCPHCGTEVPAANLALHVAHCSSQHVDSLCVTHDVKQSVLLPEANCELTATVRTPWPVEADDDTAEESDVAPVHPLCPEEYRSRLIEFYEDRDPSKLGNVDKLMARYVGQESVLLQTIERKYNLDQGSI